MLLLARRSDDQAAHVWGRQEKMADELGRSRHSVIRYSAEAEQLGYLRVFRSKPERDRETGRYFRRRSNAYYFSIPAKSSTDQPAPRRRERAPSCPVAHLRRSPATSPPSGEWGEPQTPPVDDSEPSAATKPSWTGLMSPAIEDLIASTRAKLHGPARLRDPVVV
jgi:hypothetical protein